MTKGWDEIFAGRVSLKPKNPSPHPSKKAILDWTDCLRINLCASETKIREQIRSLIFYCSTGIQAD